MWPISLKISRGNLSKEDFQIATNSKFKNSRKISNKYPMLKIKENGAICQNARKVPEEKNSITPRTQEKLPTFNKQK